jgi:hypothetical protein
MTNYDIGQLKRVIHHQYQISVTDQNMWHNARMRIIVGCQSCQQIHRKW